MQESMTPKSPIISGINDIYIRSFTRDDAVFKRIIYKLPLDHHSPSTTTNRSIDETDFDLVMVEPIDRSVMVADDWSGL
jgi:hypothetical protein